MLLLASAAMRPAEAQNPPARLPAVVVNANGGPGSVLLKELTVDATVYVWLR